MVWVAKPAWLETGMLAVKFTTDPATAVPGETASETAPEVAYALCASKSNPETRVTTTKSPTNERWTPRKRDRRRHGARSTSREVTFFSIFLHEPTLGRIVGEFL